MNQLGFPILSIMLAVPLCGLYGVSIIVAWIFGKKRVPAEAAATESSATRS